MPSVMHTSFQLIGGLGLFLYGMQLMADGLQKTAGDRLRRLLEILTSTPLTGMLVGAAVTILIQSSSATSVMVIGFVNAGLMSLEQALSVIMGAAVGTTMTAFMVSLKLSDLALPAIGIGFLLTLVGKKKATRFVGQAILGFGILFLGLTFMGDAMKPLKTSPFFTSMILSFSHQPVLGVIAGAIFTTLVQSSSATTGLVVTLASEGLLDLSASLSLMLGSNIGTTITAILASIGMQLNAKRTAVAQVIFKSIGVVICLILFQPFVKLVSLTHPTLARQAANGHVIFNLVNALVMLPFIPTYVRLVKRLLPGVDQTEQLETTYLDEHLISTPSVALGQATRELTRMGNIALSMLDDAFAAFHTNDLSKLADVAHKEETVNYLEHAIVDYLVKLSQVSLSHEQSERLNALQHVANDLERIGDHAENISELASFKIEHRLPMSDEATAELADIEGRVRALLETAVNILTTGNISEAIQVITSEGDIDMLEKNLRRQHIKRLNSGICFPASGITYLDMISNLERIADHCNNIAEALAGIEEDESK